jgi:hypothetical protein
MDFLTAFEIYEKCRHYEGYFYIKGILMPSHLKSQIATRKINLISNKFQVA